MSDREQSPKHTAKTPSHRTGIFASRSSLLRGNGSSASSHRALSAAVGCMAVAIGMLAFASPALADSAKAPEVSEVSYASAHVKTEITAGEGFKQARVQYSTDDTNWTTAFAEPAGGTVNKVIEGNITGLKGGTKYFVRIVIFNFAGETETPSPGPNPSFTTLTADPTSVISTDNASEVEYTQVKVSGHVNRPEHSDDLTCNFEYITDTDYQANPPADRFAGAPAPIPCVPSPVTTIGSSEVSAQLTGLSPSTTYHLRLAVSNANSSDAKEAPATFTTQGPVPAPTVDRIDNAAEVEYSRASLSGEVSRPPGADPILNAECNFEYIKDVDYQANPVGERFAGASALACDEPNNLIVAPGPTAVTAKLTGLSPSTTYHLRLSAKNAGGSDSKEASTFTTLGPVTKPTIIETGEATAVDKRSAKASGKVERPAGVDPAFDVNCQFEFITDAQFSANEGNGDPGFSGATPAGCAQNPITSPAPDYLAVSAEVSAELGGLEPATTYHLRLSATNGGGTVTEDAPSTFTTVAIVPPTFTIDPVTEVGYTTAHITGIGDPGNQGFSSGIQWVVDPDSEAWAGGDPRAPGGEEAFASPGSPPVALSKHATGLKPGTTYKVRVASFNSEDQADSVTEAPYVEFTTKGTSTPPSVSCDPVTGVSSAGAHFSCTLDTHAPAGPLDDEGKATYKTEWHFECTPACPPQPGLSGTLAAEEGSQAISLDAIRLDAHTHYEVKLIAKNAFATVESTVQPFDTPLIKPTVTALPGGPDGEGGYTLAGVVNPNNSAVTSCEFKWGPDSNYVFKVDCSPPAGGKGKPVTVEAHLTSLNPGSVYHFRLFATNEAGTEESNPDREFTPTLAVKGPVCENEQLREENDSLALPECRAYEMVTEPNKEGKAAQLEQFSGGDAVLFGSLAGNLDNSGQGNAFLNHYVATRTTTGWQTIPNLNGPTGWPTGPPEYTTFDSSKPPFAYSSDLLSSVWAAEKKGSPANLFLRDPDGRFEAGNAWSYSGAGGFYVMVRASDDLSHLILAPTGSNPSVYGPGVYEFVGINNDQPRRVDFDNSGSPITSCTFHTSDNRGYNAGAVFNSGDGRVIVVEVRGGCGAPNPPANEIWVRVEGTTSYDASASLCTRPDCNAPADAIFQGAAKDGSRVYFTTTQQLVNGDTDETNDLYACDIPATPQAPVDPANPCAALHQVSAGSDGKADVQQVLRVSDDGSTAYFTAEGVLADNEDALGEEALPGDKNLYVWRTDAAHPNGQTTFVAQLPETDAPFNPVAQTTPDGRYLLLQTAGQLLATDTDESIDIYRYDADTEEMARVSTAVSGAGGNANFDASVSNDTGHNSHPAISDNGQLIVFATEEQLSPPDGNGEPDAYLWNDGHALGSVAPLLPGFSGGQKTPGAVAIDGSGQDIYIDTAARLNPSDVDFQNDVFDARIGGGFPQHQQGCAGETCQPSASAPPAPLAPDPRASDNPGAGNPPQPKPCPKGKVRKHGKCVKKSHGKHHKKKDKGHAKRASHHRGGSK